MSSFTSNQPYLVTGGAGFIGSHLVDWLRKAGRTVRVLDDLSSGRKDNLPEEIDFRHGSVTRPEQLRAACEGVCGVFHLAAVASVARCSAEPEFCTRVNVEGTRHVFEAALARKVPVVYASSAAVYGDQRAMPLDEAAELHPIGAYGAHKLENERAAAKLTEQGLRALGVRPFNVYGPRQDPKSPYSGVISIFGDRLRAGEPILLHGDGAQTRDFIEVGDVVATFSGTMALLEAAGERDGGIRALNACGGTAVSIRSLAEELMRISGRNVPLRETSPREGDIRHSCGSPVRARALLKLDAPLPLSEGLTRLWRSLEK